MKQTIITLLCLLIFTGSKAQIEKGSIALGLNAGLGFTYDSDKYQSNNSFRISAQPVFEYFIANNLSLGAAVNSSFQFSNSEYTEYTLIPYSYKSDNYRQTYSLNILLKKYWFASPQIGFTVSPQLASTYAEENASNTNDNRTTTYNTNYWYSSAMLNVGAVYFVRPNLAIEAQTNFINYSNYPGSPSSNNNERHSFSVLAFQSSLTLGIKYVFGKKKDSLTP
ncbi:MAG: hypothetical protein V4620_01830 [Bacteroidota bacterium]